MDASLKRSGRAGPSSWCHWYLAGGLQLVLAFSRYVALFTSTVIVKVDIHNVPRLPGGSSSPRNFTANFFIALYGALGFPIVFPIVFFS